MLIILSGCSGGGKTTLLEELGRRGFATVPEPGLRIVEEEQHGTGLALPWVDLASFARRAIDLARSDLANLTNERGPVFFDRGLIDAVAALEFATGKEYPQYYPTPGLLHHTVYMVPPWPQNLIQSNIRNHSLEAAVAEYERLLGIYARLGFSTEILPQEPLTVRADRVLASLGIC